MTSPSSDTHDESATRLLSRASVACMTPSRERSYTAMNALARLILKRKDELELSWYDIAERGEFSSHTIPYALAMKKKHDRPAELRTLTRLATALELPLDMLKAAAMDAAGYGIVEGTPTTLEAAEDTRVVVHIMSRLEAKDRARLRRIAQSFLTDTTSSLAVSSAEGQADSDADAVRAELSEAAEKVRKSKGATVRSIKRTPPRKT